MTNVLDEWVRTTRLNDALAMEECIRILLQPKPRWLPQRFWNRLVSRLLVIEEYRQ